MAINTEYSFKDFTGQTFVGLPPEDFNGVIKGSRFDQPNRNTPVFPADSTPVFDGCSLRNVDIPAGASVLDLRGIDTAQYHADETNDGSPWVVDKDTGVPIEPQHKQAYIDVGLSINPNDIPVVKADRPLLLVEQEKGVE